jgi:hypothetical protein
VFFTAKTGVSLFPEEATATNGSKTIAEAGIIKSASFIVIRLRSIETIIDNLSFRVIG